MTTTIETEEGNNPNSTASVKAVVKEEEEEEVMATTTMITTQTTSVLEVVESSVQQQQEEDETDDVVKTAAAMTSITTTTTTVTATETVAQTTTTTTTEAEVEVKDSVVDENMEEETETDVVEETSVTVQENAAPTVDVVDVFVTTHDEESSATDSNDKNTARRDVDDKETEGELLLESSGKATKSSSNSSPLATTTTIAPTINKNNNKNDPIPVWQQKAAHVFANFRTGIALQHHQQHHQQQQHQQHLLQPKQEMKSDKPKEMQDTTKQDAAADTASANGDGDGDSTNVTLAPSTNVDLTPHQTPKEDDTPERKPSTDTANANGNNNLSPCADSHKPSDKNMKEKKTSNNSSPSGVLDLPALLQCLSKEDSADQQMETPKEKKMDNNNDDSDYQTRRPIDIPPLKTDLPFETTQEDGSKLMQQEEQANENQDDTAKIAIPAEKLSPNSSSFLGASLLSSWTRSVSPTHQNSNNNTNDNHHQDDDDDDDQEVAHVFEPHTYQKPTKCDICTGLLVGLWSQGLQCRECGMNVHRGEGSNDHTNCRAEALLQDGGCRRHRQQAILQCQPVTSNDNTSPNNNSNNNLSDAIQQVRQLAREQPNFFQDVKAQIDRDLKSRVKSIIVSKGAEEQRNKSLLRFRNNVVVPTAALLDRIESPQQHSWGGYNKLAYAILMLFHLTTVAMVCVATWMGLSIALWGINNNNNTTDKTERSLVSSHMAAIVYAFHLALASVVLLLRRLILSMHRKSKVLDQFLHEVFSLSAEEDLGMSVHQFATRARLWSRRLTNSTVTMLLVTFFFYRWTHTVMSGTSPGTHSNDVDDTMMDVSDALDDLETTRDSSQSLVNLPDLLWMVATIVLLPTLTSTLHCHRYHHHQSSAAVSSFSTTTTSTHFRIILCLFLMQQAVPSAIASAVGTEESTASGGGTTRMAFGSCHKNIKAANPPIWDVVDKDEHGNAQTLDAWLWLGDATYGPKRSQLETGPDSIASIQRGLVDLKTNRTIGYGPFLERNPDMVVAGIWDDHDFGGNDMGDQMPNKLQRRDLFWEFLDYGTSDANDASSSSRNQPTRWDHQGLYHRIDLEGGRARVLALDTRWFRASHCIPSVALS
jgi:Phorbol esters/diacylglycerol binding domain (C1 domain)